VTDTPLVAWAVVVPLAGAAGTLLAGRRAARLVPLVTAVALLGVAGALARAVLADGVLRHAVGGWAAPLGIGLRADGLAAAVILLVAVVGAGVTTYARAYLPPGEARRAWAPWLFLQAALIALALSADAFNLYVCLELVTFAGVGLMALHPDPGAVAAALRYLLTALLGSLLYLLGVALLYAQTGTLDLGQLALRVQPGPVAWIAAGAMTAGLALKAALVPLHGWLPPAHAGAPAPVSAALSALVVKAGVLVLLRLWFEAFLPLHTHGAAMLLGALGALAIAWGSVQALRAERLKLVVAWSTVAQLGYLFVALPLADAGDPLWSAQAWSGALFQLLAHGLAKAALFLAAGTLIRTVGGDRLADLAGTGGRAPVAWFAVALAGTSLMGLPPSGGFVAKWLLLEAALAQGQWWWAVPMLAGGLLAAAYTFRVLRAPFAEPASPATTPPAGGALAWAPLALAACAIALGLVAPQPLALLAVGAPVGAHLVAATEPAP
jgi:formate hydrogenlyase subunit 3/multisubunit Na+/H+ antiporter MnhD subunit